MCVCSAISALGNTPALLIEGAEVVIQSLKDSLPLLVPVVNLDLLVVVCNQLLHIDTPSFGDPEHDFALSLDGLVR